MNESVRLKLVETQVIAYNKKDIELFCAQYHDQVEVYRRKSSVDPVECIVKGMADFRPMYVARFKDAPDLHCQIISRIVLNEHILDEESVLTHLGQPRSHIVAVYGFQDDRIKTVLFLR